MRFPQSSRGFLLSPCRCRCFGAESHRPKVVSDTSEGATKTRVASYPGRPFPYTELARPRRVPACMPGSVFATRIRYCGDSETEQSLVYSGKRLRRAECGTTTLNRPNSPICRHPAERRMVPFFRRFENETPYSHPHQFPKPGNPFRGFARRNQAQNRAV